MLLDDPEADRIYSLLGTLQRVYAFSHASLHPLPYPNRRVIRREGQEAANGRERKRSFPVGVYKHGGEKGSKGKGWK